MTIHCASAFHHMPECEPIKRKFWLTPPISVCRKFWKSEIPALITIASVILLCASETDSQIIRSHKRVGLWSKSQHTGNSHYALFFIRTMGMFRRHLVSKIWSVELWKSLSRQVLRIVVPFRQHWFLDILWASSWRIPTRRWQVYGKMVTFFFFSESWNS